MTNNIAGRVEKHNRGLGPEFTKRRRPVELIWSQEFSDRFEAREREVELKGWTRKKKLSLIAGLEKSEGNPRATTQGKPFAGAAGSRSG
jgi:predicted GIY-YIG superfamily endonuclease